MTKEKEKLNVVKVCLSKLKKLSEAKEYSTYKDMILADREIVSAMNDQEFIDHIRTDFKTFVAQCKASQTALKNFAKECKRRQDEKYTKSSKIKCNVPMCKLCKKSHLNVPVFVRHGEHYVQCGKDFSLVTFEPITQLNKLGHSKAERVT